MNIFSSSKECSDKLRMGAGGFGSSRSAAVNEGIVWVARVTCV